MQLFYSNATLPGYPQTSPLKSLGGYLSNSPFRSAVKDALFPSLALTDRIDQRPQYRCLFLQNTTGSTVTSFNIGLAFDTLTFPVLDVQVGVIGATNNNQVQPIFVTTEQPVGVSFNEVSLSYSSCLLTITEGPTTLETIVLLGVTINTTANEIGSIPNLVSLIESKFVGNTSYSVISNDQSSLLITSLIPGVVVQTITWDTTGTSYAPTVTLQGGVDNTKTFSTSLAPLAVVGVWFKRIIYPPVQKSFTDLYTDYLDYKQLKYNTENDLYMSTYDTQRLENYLFPKLSFDILLEY